MLFGCFVHPSSKAGHPVEQGESEWLADQISQRLGLKQ